MNFNEFLDKLYESFENPASITWNDIPGNILIGSFEINSNYYRIECKYYDNDIFTFKFLVFDVATDKFTMELTDTDTNNKMRVIGTIREGMNYLIINKKPKGIIFSALDESFGRKLLYTRFSKEIVKNFNYDSETYKKDDYQVYYLYKDISLELLLNVVGGLIDRI